MRIAVCDDQEACLLQVRQLILDWQNQPEDLTVHFYEDGDTLLQAHAAAPYDILLLDVVMPLLSGMDTARELRQTDKNVKIVFLTSSPEFALEGYAVKASNYLLKPLDPEKFHGCLNELSSELQQNARCINVKSSGSVSRVAIDAIEYIESQNKHILFVLSDGRTIRSAEPLYAFEDKLQIQEGFFKPSRGFLVNLHRIDTYTPKEIRMGSGARIPISRGSHREFEAAYFSVIFGKAGDLA